jgi:hypothetical protein
MLHTLRISLQNAVYFHNATCFGSCIIHILHTGVLKFKCKTPVPKGYIHHSGKENAFFGGGGRHPGQRSPRVGKFSAKFRL